MELVLICNYQIRYSTGNLTCFNNQQDKNISLLSLKVHSKHDQVRRHRIHDKKEDHATAEFGVDEFTRLLLYKMINKQLLEKVNGVISIGIAI